MENECQDLLDVLVIYEGGLQVKRLTELKLLYFFSKTAHEMQLTIKEALGVPVVQQYEKYLGYPSFIGQKKDSFANIKQWIWKKLQGCETKLLTQVGREILIKAVAQALPMYTMSYFKLPVTLCHEIEALICRYFRRQRGDNRNIHWLKWETMYKLVLL